MLWLVWLTSNMCMWMNDVAAAWLMTSLTHSPVMIALVQSASTLPVFLLGVPSGAAADILDRRRYFIATQFWVAVVATVLMACSINGALTPSLLLALTFANGIGLAMRWPVFAAVVPDLVERPQLPAALALNGVAMNTSRIFGPICAGALLAAAGEQAVFALNAVLSIGAGIALIRWRHAPRISPLPSERFFGALRVGVQYVRQSPAMRVVILRTVVFFMQATALMALLPLVAKRVGDGGASTFTFLFAAMGAGAILGATLVQRLRRLFQQDELLRNSTMAHAVLTAIMAWAPNLWVALPTMVLAGFAWISIANSLVVSAQLALPGWVRARGMAIFQAAMMGGNAAGAAIWGQVASWTNVQTSLVLAAVAAVVAWAATRHFRLSATHEEDHTPMRVWKEPEPAFAVAPDQGPVMVTIRYRIDPTRTREFMDVMRESRGSRLRHGALAWELFRDTTEPDTWIEYYIDESWVQHLRRFDRATASDIELVKRKYAFHLDEGPPRITRFIAQSVDPALG